MAVRTPPHRVEEVRRRTKKAPTKTGVSWGKVAVRGIIMLGAAAGITLLLGGVGFGAMVGYEAATKSEYLTVSAVRIVGNGEVTKEEIEKGLTAILGRQILELDLDELGEALASHPWIEKVNVRRDLPDRLTVEVTERRPVAGIVSGARRWLVDAHGVLLDARAVEADDPFAVVTVRGVVLPKEAKPGDYIDPSVFDPAVKVGRRLGGYKLLGIGGLASVDVARPDRLDLTFTGLTAVVAAPRGAWRDELARLATVDYLLRHKRADVDRINLLFDGKVVVTFTGENQAAKGA